jgi:hypothetical protein
MGRVFATPYEETGPLYMIDPAAPAGAATAVVPDLGQFPGHQMAFDGARLWIPMQGAGIATGLVIVTPTASIPWSVTRVDYPLPASPNWLTFDGTTMWLTDDTKGVQRLDSAGNVVQTIGISGDPGRPAFDGTNLWVPVSTATPGTGSVVVIRVSDGTVISTITGNGLDVPSSAAFDGERVLVVNPNTGVSVFRATSQAPLGNFPLGSQAFQACSDGLNFWIPLQPNQLGRY